MSLNSLGQSDLKVSAVSFGCMSLDVQRAESEKILQRAFEQEINFFDTADLYQKGENEVLVGRALKSIRKEVILATKVGNQWRTDGSGWDWNPTKAYILKAVEQSLRRLQTDYIDLYQLHGGTIDDPIDDTIEAFELLKAQGKIRWYGISSIRPNVISEYVKRSNIVSVMMQYSLLDHRPEEELLDKLKTAQIGVITRGTLAQGRLIGEKEDAYLHYSVAEVREAADAIRLLADQLSVEKIAVALAYVLNHPAVCSVVTGIRTDKQLDDAIYALRKSLSLSALQHKQLRSKVNTFIYDQHR